MIGYDDIKAITEASNASGLTPPEEVRNAGIDPDAVVKIAEQLAASTALLIMQGGDPGEAVVSNALSGFHLGVLVGQKAAEVAA